MNQDQQIIDKKAYLEYLQTIIEGRLCARCHKFSMHTDNSCRSCGEPFQAPECWICRDKINPNIFNYSIGQDMVTKDGVFEGTFFMHNKCLEKMKKVKTS